jgi:hypothetical protein
VTLLAIERLIPLHPDADGFRLALGTSSGRDIESIMPDLVAAEVFSATCPGSNQKLKTDLVRLSADPARHRYVFFASPGFAAGRHINSKRSPASKFTQSSSSVLSVQLIRRQLGYELRCAHTFCR